MATLSTNAHRQMDILSRVIRPETNDLTIPAAQSLLKLDFEERDRDRMQGLARKARDGSLTPDEQADLDGYEVVGHLLGLLHSKARRAIRKRRSST
jgi:hypothetical protein